jgi:hypothetical protein
MRFLIVSIILNYFINIDVTATTILDGYTDKLSYRYGETVTFFPNADTADIISVSLLDINGNIVDPFRNSDALLVC